MTAKVIPSDATDKTICWESSNPEIAEISIDGSLQALSYGTTLIIATTKEGGYTATCTVNVYEHTTGVEMVDKVTIPIDKTYTLNAQTLPLSKSDGKVTYTSDNSTIASINEKGIVIANKKGTCTITATSIDGDYTATCEVTVTQPVEALTLEKHELNLKIGETGKLYAQIIPVTANDKTVVWTSSDDKVATVDAKGVVTAVKGGEAWIKAVAKDNAEAKDSCNVIIPDTPAPAQNGQCATPTIIAMGNKIRFECDTPEAEFTSYLTTSEEFTGSEVEVSNKDLVFTLTVYATAPDYDRSQPATMKFVVKKTDVNGDGHVDVADIATIISEMAAQARMQEETTE